MTHNLQLINVLIQSIFEY